MEGESTELSAVSAEITLKCAICLELYTDPVVIPCLHTFCLECLEKLAINDDGQLTCPQCRAQHMLPKCGVSEYPIDLSLLPELEIAKGQEQVKTCGFCTTGDAAVAYCEDCEEYLCECCRDVVHKRGKIFQSHKIITSPNEAPLSARLNKENSYCPKHNDYKLELFCKTCETVVCSICMLSSIHKEHEYDFMKNSNDEIMTKIKEITEGLEKQLTKAKVSLSSAKNFENALENKRAALELQINTVCDEYIEMIQKMKRSVLNELESNFTNDSKKVWSIKNSLETNISQITSCIAFSKRYQKQGHIVSLTGPLLKNLNEARSMQVTTSEIFTTMILQTSFEKSKFKLKSLGTLKIKQNDMSGTFKLVSEVNLHQKVILSFTLNHSVHPFGLFECYCTDKSTQLSVPCNVVKSESETNQLLIEFIPVTIGQVQVVLENAPLCFKYVLTTSLAAGTRVRRNSANWTFGNEDGGKANLGTITGKAISIGYDVQVKWDAQNGATFDYNYHDLEPVTVNMISSEYL